MQFLYPLLRLIYALTDYPRRLMRLFRHFLTIRRYQVFPWSQDLVFLLGDLFLLLDLWDIACALLKYGSRSLNKEEQMLASFIFGNTLRQDLVLIDEKAYLGPTRQGVVYVSGFTINAYLPVHSTLLVHELVHVWQYQQQGATYIPRALRAQFSKQGYDYGGLQTLEAKPKLSDYNLEQQADIVMDYFLLSQGHRPQWAPDAQFSDLALYETFVQQIRQKL
jgi:hypothetical protein